jgi:hypothetical protein
MSDLTVYTANQFLDWLTQGQIDQPPSQIYVGLININGTEISGIFDQGRVETSASQDWAKNSQTEVTNASKILWQNPITTVQVQSVGLFDSDLNTGGDILIKTEVDNAPINILPSGDPDVRIQAGELVFDMLDVTE